MIAEIKTLKHVCDGDISKVANYIRAINDAKHTWHLHHKLGLNHSIQELKENNLYYHRPPEELEFLPPDDANIIDVYDDIKSHAGKHKDAKRRIESEFEFQSYINQLGRQQCNENKIITNSVQFESWIEPLLNYERIKYRLDNEALSIQTGLSKKFIEGLE